MDGYGYSADVVFFRLQFNVQPKWWAMFQAMLAQGTSRGAGGVLGWTQVRIQAISHREGGIQLKSEYLFFFLYE